MFRRFLLIAILLSAGALARAAPPCVLTQRWNEDPPYSMRAADGSIVGINVELLREALSRLECSAVLVELPWARAVAELKAGRLDILPGMLRTAEREAFAHFVMERWHSRNTLFAHVEARPRWPRERLDELLTSGFRLGAQIGVNYGPAFAALDADPAFHRLLDLGASRERLWQMLRMRRIDGLIADEWTARYELTQLGLQDLVKTTGLVLSDEAAGIAFSKASVKADFAQRFAAVIDAMARDGSYRAIVQKYAAGAP